MCTSDADQTLEGSGSVTARASKLCCNGLLQRETHMHCNAYGPCAAGFSHSWFRS